MKRKISLLICGWMLTTPYAVADDYSKHQYIVDAYANYGSALNRCDAIRGQASIPGKDVLDALRRYNIDDIRIFLVGREYALLDRCAQEELLDLLLAAESLNASKDLPPETKATVQAIKETFFNGTRLKMELQYRSLPPHLLKDLESLPYFQKPFDSFDVIDAVQK